MSLSTPMAEAGPKDVAVNVARLVQHKLRQRHLTKLAQGRSEEEVVEKMKVNLSKLPIRDISQDSLSQNFLRENRIYLSMTTSPKRLSKIHHVLETIDWSHVSGLFLNLPEKFGRDGSTYDIPPEIASNPKILILRPKKDLGPATKIVPAIEELNRRGEPQALVISLDDDMGYPPGLVNDYIYIAARMPPSVFSMGAQNYEFWGMDGSTVRPESSAPSSRKIGNSSFVAYQRDVVEGFGAIAYRPSLVDTAAIRRLALSSREAFASDDLTISLALENSHVDRFVVASRYANREQIYEYPYGFGADALAAGAGTDFEGPTTNHQKYRATFQQYLTRNGHSSAAVRCEELFTVSR